jgi:hypothetical protein
MQTGCRQPPIHSAFFLDPFLPFCAQNVEFFSVQLTWQYKQVPGSVYSRMQPHTLQGQIGVAESSEGPWLLPLAGVVVACGVLWSVVALTSCELIAIFWWSWAPWA